MRVPILVVLFLINLCLGDDILLESEADDHQNWIDPNDPTAHLPNFAPSNTGQCTESPNSSDPTLKLIIRNLLRQLNVDPAQRMGFYRTATVQLQNFDVGIIQDYLAADAPSPMLREQMRNAFNEMFEVVDFGLDDPSRLQMFRLSVEPFVMPLNLIFVTVGIVYVLLRIFSSGSLIKMLLLLIFVSSLLISYNRMYQQKMAERLALSAQREDSCQSQGIFQQSLGFLKSMVTVQKKSECLKFIEAQTVSIMFEISPFDVLFDVVGNGLFSLMEHFATRLNRAAVALYDGLPIQLQLLLTIVVGLLFIVVFFFGVSQYRISWFGFRFEPANNNAGLLNQIGNAVGNVVDALEPNVQRAANSPPLAANAIQNAVPEQQRLGWEAPPIYDDPHVMRNVTPRTRDRIRRILDDRRRQVRSIEYRDSDSSESPMRRSRSTPRLANID